MILYNFTRSYILYVARFMFQIYVLDRQIDRQTDRQIDRQIDRHEDRQIDRQIDRQTDRQRLTDGKARRTLNIIQLDCYSPLVGCTDRLINQFHARFVLRTTLCNTDTH